MQVIEKVKVVPEGYNGAGMDGMYGRRDVNGKANAGLTLGIIGTALGAWALFGNRRSTGVLGTGAGLMGDGSTNINVVGVGGGNGAAPTAFQAEVLNLVRAKIEGSPEGKALLDSQLKLVKNLKTSIIEMSQREMQLFNAFKEASAKNPSLTYDEFIKTMK